MYDDDTALFVISVAAELAGMHPQTLRQYDRLGLVSPSRARGRGRRYSARDVAQLREVQRLSQEDGVNLAGIKRIMDLENHVLALGQRVEELEAEVALVRSQARRIFAAGMAGDIVATPMGRRPESQRSNALVVWRPEPRR
ncbi:heat shock protein transcriptional repressor HspR [Kineococcus sp. GCM10028916]|uniref:heat shock protein transcriptional repressor HspR n=1 Tax=unclassified Kineococcus TaxID=2621656 RepID=UPI002E22732F